MNHVAINVRRLRLAQGLTQIELARMAGVARPTISNLESAHDASPSLRTLDKVAAALKTDTSALITPLKMPKQIRFRAMQEFKSREQVVVDAMHAYELYRKLELCTGSELQGNSFKELRQQLQQMDISGVERAQKAAQMVRCKLNVSEYAALPRITHVIEELGVRVITIPYHTDAFGLSFVSSEGHPVVVVNMSERITVERWIFSAAHELGHLLLHWNDHEDFEMVEEDLNAEHEANIFAAELLLPVDAFKQAWNAMGEELLLDKVLAIKRSFAVSYQTVLHRVSTLQGESDYKECLERFLVEYQIRYGITLTRKDEAHTPAPTSAYDPFIIPVSTTSEEPENVGAGAPRRDMFLPQGRMMRLLIEGIRDKALGVRDVEQILHTSGDSASAFMAAIQMAE